MFANDLPAINVQGERSVVNYVMENVDSVSCSYSIRQSRSVSWAASMPINNSFDLNSFFQVLLSSILCSYKAHLHLLPLGAVSFTELFGLS